MRYLSIFPSNCNMVFSPVKVLARTLPLSCCCSSGCSSSTLLLLQWSTAAAAAASEKGFGLLLLLLQVSCCCSSSAAAPFPPPSDAAAGQRQSAAAVLRESHFLILATLRQHPHLCILQSTNPTRGLSLQQGGNVTSLYPYDPPTPSIPLIHLYILLSLLYISTSLYLSPHPTQDPCLSLFWHNPTPPSTQVILSLHWLNWLIIN